ncbi:proprotein convertase P-domain-containing protein [bacterium]|nr:proprotein convertase P-domain-containing protein [bacterium]
MKVVRLSVALVALAFLFSLTAQAQLNREFEYKMDPNAPIVDFSTTSSSIDIPDVFNISSLAVMVDIDHPAAADLTIKLTGPTGSYTLSTQNGLAGANYENTIFDSNPGTAIPGVAVNSPGNVTAFFRGVYIPESSLPTSGSATGLWTLEVTDNLLGDNGTLVRWGLIFNRYDNYRDIRGGVDLNYVGSTTLNVLGLVDDFTTIPPYTVQGHRPLNNVVTAEGYIQNSQTPGVLNLTLDHRYPGNSTTNLADVDLGIPAEDAYRLIASFNLNSMTGTHNGELGLFMRGDLFMTRPDNDVVVPLDVTAGSLAFDNGMVQNTLFPMTDECDVNVYTIYAPQTITSVDVWQGSTVELEPPASTSAMTINVWDVTSNTIVASTGPVPFPPQGDKWVSYPFPTPVSLPAGTYRIGTCMTSVDPGSFGPGIGMDQTGSPFEPLGFLSRYYGFGVQEFSLDGGMTWFADDFRTFNTKMIRPNFIQQSDVGVVAIYPNNGFGGLDVTVDFAAYAHYSYLPNQITFGKVWVIDNSTMATVGYQEKRVFLNQAPFMDTQVYNFPSLTSGSYTIKVVIERPDDENLINNEYSRQLVVPFAPMVVSTPGAISSEQKNQIITSYAQQGVECVFVDRNLGAVEYPANGKVLFVGDLDRSSAAVAREYVKNGGNFAVLPEFKLNKHPMTDVFSQVATTKELDAMNRVLATPKLDNVQMPANSAIVAQLSNPASPVFAVNKVSNEMTNRVAQFYARMQQYDQQPTMRRDAREAIVFSNSDEISVVGERIGDLRVVNVLAKDPRPADRRFNEIANAASFELTQNYPNPFNPTTNIAFNVPSDAHVTVRVYDMLGREVATLIDGFQSAGSYITTWDATNGLGQTVASGIYLYRMEATPVDGSAPYAAAKKMVLTR